MGCEASQKKRRTGGDHDDDLIGVDAEKASCGNKRSHIRLRTSAASSPTRVHRAPSLQVPSHQYGKTSHSKIADKQSHEYRRD